MKSAQLHKANRISNNPYDGNPNLWSVVAFQDEITRSLNLSDPPSFPKPKKPVPRTLPPLDARPSATSYNLPSRHSSSPSPSLSSSLPSASHRASVPPLRNSVPITRASAYPARGPASSARGPASSARGPASSASPKNKAKSRKAKEEDIIVVEQKKYNLTLAQKMGLTPAPPMPLSHTEWEKVKKISDTRQDSHMPCVICQDEFRADGQVLLSCSHVFHKICLDSFEKYSRTKCCPLCRKQEYQKAQISEGKKVYLNKCATKIQAVYRGYLARKLFQQILDANPPEDPERRKVFYARKLERITNQLIKRIDQDQAVIDSSINAMSYNVAASIAYLRSVNIDSMLNPNSINWKDVAAQARERNTQDCPICIMPLVPHRTTSHSTHSHSSTSYSSSSAHLSHSSTLTHKPLTLLSCTHVFHETCITSFEHYNCETVHLCPVCRTMYHKTRFQ